MNTYDYFQRGNTALHIAAIHGQTEVVKLLIQDGAQVNTKSKVRPFYRENRGISSVCVV